MARLVQDGVFAGNQADTELTKSTQSFAEKGLSYAPREALEPFSAQLCVYLVSSVSA